jgi:hypothetical protein
MPKQQCSALSSHPGGAEKPDSARSQHSTVELSEVVLLSGEPGGKSWPKRCRLARERRMQTLLARCFRTARLGPILSVYGSSDHGGYASRASNTAAMARAGPLVPDFASASSKVGPAMLAAIFEQRLGCCTAD